MSSSHAVLVAYAPEGFRLALRMAEILGPIAKVQLCSDDQLEGRLSHDLDVALCIVTGDESIKMAHMLQARLEEVPTCLVDGSGGRPFDINGFAGTMSSSPDQVLKRVSQFLLTNKRRGLQSTPMIESSRLPRKLSSPFAHILARTAGRGQTPKAILIAAARQLCWDLRAERVEAFLQLPETRAFEKIYADPETLETPESENLPPEFLRFIKKCSYPATLQELESRSFHPLSDYLIDRNLNLLAPLVSETHFLGWLAFRFDIAKCTEDFLDDLQVAMHLLMLSLTEAHLRESADWERDRLHEALSSLKSGLVVVDSEGQIVALSGAIPLLGSNLQDGDSFQTIRNSRAREVIAHALRGNFVEKSWMDFSSQETLLSYSAGLRDGKIVMFWGPRRPAQPEEVSSGREIGSIGFDLKKVLESLPVPVRVETGVSPEPSALPQGWITSQNYQAILTCARQAEAKNVKTLRLRLSKDRSPASAVLFFETPSGTLDSAFSDDIKQAVRFSIATEPPHTEGKQLLVEG